MFLLIFFEKLRWGVSGFNSTNRLLGDQTTIPLSQGFGWRISDEPPYPADW